MNNAKEQYMLLRANRTGLVLDQLAFYAPNDAAAEEVMETFGLLDADWTVDYVVGRCSVYGGTMEESCARLLFNYDLGIELEILTYLSGPNWHDYRWRKPMNDAPNPYGDKAFMSHIGFHVNDEDLPNLPFEVAQRMVTESHSNPAIANRSYEYVIFDTYDQIGHALKYIKRRI